MDREDEPRTALVALLDGTIQLVDRNSMGVRWAFDSGPPIYSSYQAQSSSGYFIYCGDDWDLYEHSDHFGRRVCHRNTTVFCLLLHFFVYD